MAARRDADARAYEAQAEAARAEAEAAKAAADAAEEAADALRADRTASDEARAAAEAEVERLRREQARAAANRDVLAARLESARAEAEQRQREYEAVVAQAEAARREAEESAAAAETAQEAAQAAQAETASAERRRMLEQQYWIAIVAALLLAALASMLYQRRRSRDRRAEADEAHRNAIAQHEAQQELLQTELQHSVRPAACGLMLEGTTDSGSPLSLKITKEQLGRAAGAVVGRNAHDVDTVLDDPEVSRKHLRVRTGTDGPEIEDLGSTNGTFVNGRRLSAGERVRVDPDDDVGIGKTIRFRLRAE